MPLIEHIISVGAILEANWVNEEVEEGANPSRQRPPSLVVREEIP